MKEKMYKIIHIFLLVIITIIIVSAGYLKLNFSSTNFEEIIFYLKSGVESADNSVFTCAVLYCLPFALIGLLIFYTLFYGFKLFKIDKEIKPIPFLKDNKKITTFLLFIISLLLLGGSVKFFGYVIYNKFDSNFIEKNYVDPKKTKIEFKEKRNLIMVYVESLESSLFTKKQGGYWNYEVIPELNKILDDKDTVTFYNENKAEMSNMLQGTSWTTASLVANNAAVPFKIRIKKNGYHSKNFMNGTYALGDLLKDNGYYNEVISGAKTSFGGLKEFYKKHGDYEIVDVKSLKNYGLTMKEEDKGKWGFNDNYLFEIAKKRLNEISKKEEPFNLNLVTIDTHFVDGYVGNYSETKYEEQYENAYATTSRLIYNFVNWVKEQPYYENTTIMIMGDHLSMQNEFFNRRDAKKRYVYNCIINPINKEGRFNNRIFTALDTYPTILYAMGADIKGNRLGLGVNLFSNKKTLAEKYGVLKLDKELRKKSDFYNRDILDDAYLERFDLDRKVGKKDVHSKNS